MFLEISGYIILAFGIIVLGFLALLYATPKPSQEKEFCEELPRRRRKKKTPPPRRVDYSDYEEYYVDYLRWEYQRPLPKDQAYFRACAKQKKDCLPNGGLRKGSGHHYDRGF